MASDERKELKPTNRGWLLGYSIAIVVLVFLLVFYLEEWFSFIFLFLGATKETPIIGTLLRTTTIGVFWKTTTGTTLALFVGFLLVYFKWAPNNLFFTFVREGTAKIVVKAHEFDKVLMVFKNHMLDNEGNVVEVRGVKPEQSSSKKRFLGGLKYYGFWPVYDIFIYKFEWIGVKENGELDFHPQEVIDYIILKDDVYGCLVKGAEDIELMPLDVKMAITIRIVNPYKALFVSENWYETTMNRIRSYIRDFITTDTYESFIKQKKRIDRGVWKRLQKEGILEELSGRYGVEIRKIEVVSIDPLEKFREATMAKVLALREKDAIITKARAEEERLAIVAQGEKRRINTIYSAIQSFNRLGEKVRGYEALEKSTDKGAKWVIPLEITKLFSGSEKKEHSPEK